MLFHGGESHFDLGKDIKAILKLSMYPFIQKTQKRNRERSNILMAGYFQYRMPPNLFRGEKIFAQFLHVPNVYADSFTPQAQVLLP